MIRTIANFLEWQNYRNHLRAELIGLQGAVLRPGLRDGAWTPRQVFHHVLLVDAGTADLLEKLSSKAGAVAPRNPDQPWPFREVLMDFPLDTAFSVPAFKGTEPKADVADRILRQLAESNLQRHTALASRAQRSSYDSIEYPHPLAGRLNFYEWLVFGGIHESLHLQQLRQDVALTPQP